MPSYIKRLIMENYCQVGMLGHIKDEATVRFYSPREFLYETILFLIT